MIGSIQLDNSPLVGIGREEAELSSVSVEGDLVGDGGAEYRRDDQLFGVGAGGSIYIERNRTVDTTLDIIISIIEAGKVDAACRKGAVDREGAGNKSGCSDQHR